MNNYARRNYLKGIFVFILVSILIISGCGKSSQPAQAPQKSAEKSNAANNTANSPKAEQPLKEITVATGGGGTALFGPLYLASEKDLWKQYGLKVNIQSLASPAAVAAVVSGSAQVILSGPALIGAAVKTNEVKIIGSGGKVFLSLYSKNPLKLEELKGKTVAILSPGGSIDTGVKTAIKTLGLEPGKDVKILYTGGVAASLASLSEGKVDAAGLTPPSTMQAEKTGFKLVAELTDRQGTLGLHVMLGVNRKFASKDPETIQAFMKAYVAAVKLAKSDKESTKAAIGKYTKTTDNNVLEGSYNVYSKLWPTNLHLPESEVQIELDHLAASEDPATRDAAKSKKPADLIDNRYVNAMK